MGLGGTSSPAHGSYKQCGLDRGTQDPPVCAICNSQCGPAFRAFFSCSFCNSSNASLAAFLLSQTPQSYKAPHALFYAFPFS